MLSASCASPSDETSSSVQGKMAAAVFADFLDSGAAAAMSGSPETIADLAEPARVDHLTADFSTFGLQGGSGCNTNVMAPSSAAGFYTESAFPRAAPGLAQSAPGGPGLAHKAPAPANLHRDGRMAQRRFEDQRPKPIMAGIHGSWRFQEIVSPMSPPQSPITPNTAGLSPSSTSKARSQNQQQRLVRDLHDWLCRRPEHARHIGTASSDDGGATFSEFYAEFPHHAAKRKCKGSGIKAVVETHGGGLLEWVDAGSNGMGRIQVVPGSCPPRQWPREHHSASVVPPQTAGRAVQHSAERQARPPVVFVSGLPYTSDAEIREYFESHGARLEQVARRPSGQAKIVLADNSSFEAALRLHGDRATGRRIGVLPESSVTASPPVSPRSPSQESVPEANVAAARRGRWPILKVATSPSAVMTVGADARHNMCYTKPCQYANNCHYGERCRYSHATHFETSKLRKGDTVVSPVLQNYGAGNGTGSTNSTIFTSPAEAEREYQLRRVLDDAGLEDKWLQHLLAHELDADALLLCEEQDLAQLDLALGARVKLRNWIERERGRRTAPTTPDESHQQTNEVMPPVNDALENDCDALPPSESAQTLESIYSDDLAFQH